MKKLPFIDPSTRLIKVIIVMRVLSDLGSFLIVMIPESNLFIDYQANFRESRLMEK